jgi:hypothetical protein
MHVELTSARLFSCFDDDEGADGGGSATNHRASERGILWVLRWAAAILVLSFSCGVLAEFAFCLAAEHTVARAARAGALEATLPRATTSSIRESVARRLTGYPTAVAKTRLVIYQNGRPLLGRLIARPGDRISVHVSLSSAAVLPSWLERVKFWRGNAPIEVAAERSVPGRRVFPIDHRRST